MIFQKRSGPLSFLPFVCEIELSLQSRAPFSDLIFQKCSDRDSFLRFLCEIELWLQSHAHFSNPIFQKSSERHSQEGGAQTGHHHSSNGISRFPDQFCSFLYAWQATCIRSFAFATL